MYVLRTLSAIVTAVAFTSGAAFAQIEATPIPMSPKPDFSKMMFMTGTWTCSTKSSRRPAAFQTTQVGSMSSDGYWLIVKSTTQKTPWMSSQLTSEDKMTYDPSTSRWIDIATDDQGGYNVSTSPGWSGNSITWTDAVITQTNATASTNPTTMTKVSDTKTTSANSFKEPSGRVVNVTATCTKR
jgi:hypothetical protein